MIDPLHIKYLVHENRYKESWLKVIEVQKLYKEAILIHAQNCRDFEAVKKELDVENLCKEIWECINKP